jgi:transcriptional regulator with XRE-family HTH domain
MPPLHEISRNMNNVGLNIRKLREKKGFSQEFIADKLGINQSTYGKLERDMSSMTLDRLFKIADVLEEDVTTLLDIGKKNIFNNQANQGNGYVETINNDYKAMVEELKLAYEKMLTIKDEQVVLLNSLLEKK